MSACIVVARNRKHGSYSAGGEVMVPVLILLLPQVASILPSVIVRELPICSLVCAWALDDKRPPGTLQE